MRKPPNHDKLNTLLLAAKGIKKTIKYQNKGVVFR